MFPELEISHILPYLNHFLRFNFDNIIADITTHQWVLKTHMPIKFTNKGQII